MIDLQTAISIAEKEIPHGYTIIEIYDCESFWEFCDSRVIDQPIGYISIGVMKIDGTTFLADPRFYSFDKAKKISIPKKK